MPARGGDVRKIVPLSFDLERKHGWAPDGRTLLIDDNANEADQPSNLMTVRPDGTHLRRLRHFKGGVRSPWKAHVGSSSPDGRWIVYRLTRGDREVWLRRPVAGGTPRIIRFRTGAAAAGNGDWGSGRGALHRSAVRIRSGVRTCMALDLEECGSGAIVFPR